MYLKSIEVQGFKSFANKIVFDFDKGITGIVGPNGSGKSNVADAVRWVLGEQRIKQLRGSSMSDVIFSGTELRKSVGSAYVAITLDNSHHDLAIDYEEVTVARRIYRSGESEYLINGNPCRLKDVNELFYDTGIGKEGYSIIGQGQIDKILSSKPEDRRELFDEAAGIVKFKRRKVEAEHKLENERNNLVRVSDILTELTGRVGPLEKQSEKAKIYLKKKEELKNLDVNVFLLENGKLQSDLASIEKNLDIAEGELKEANSKNEELKVNYDKISADILSLESVIEEKRAGLASNDLLKEKLEGEIKLLKEQINFANSNKEHLNERVETITASINEKEEEKKAVIEKKNVIDEELHQLEEYRDAAKEDLLVCQSDIETVNFSIEKSKNLIIELLSERATIKASLGRIDQQNESFTIRLSELSAKLLMAKTVEAEHNSVIEELENKFDEVTKKIEELNYNQKKMDEQLGLYKDEIIGLDNKLRETQNLYHQEKSKLDTISNLTERYEGYSNTIKKVMEQKSANKGILGVVADIIKVDKKYEVAIETALGGNIQNIVTDDEETAKKMIAYLKDNKLGRATFLPLTSLTDIQEFKQPESLNEKGVIGMADEIVETESKYAPVAKAMLGRILVVDNVDNALKIARKYSYGIRMVTPSGELLVPGGAISGGAFKNNSNLLGRRREMDELESKVKKLLNEIDSLMDKIEETKTKRNKLRNDIEAGKGLLQNAFIEQNTARLNVISAKEKKGDAQKDFSLLREEEAQLKESILNNDKEKEAIIKQLSQSEELEKSESILIDENSKKLEALRSDETTKLAAVNAKEVDVEKLLQQQSFEQTNVSRIDGEISKFADELAEVKESINLSAEEIAGKNDSIHEIELTLSNFETTQSGVQSELKEAIEKKDELKNKQNDFFNQRDALTASISRLEKEKIRLESQKDRIGESLAGKANYMWSEYELTLHDAMNLRDESLSDLSSMKKNVSTIKDDIRKLGDVNVNAIEEYKEVSERYEFLKNQHEDLVEAEKSLLKIIEELDDAMRKQFNSQFAKIAKEFDNVFKEMFGGGSATLELMEDEDVLEAGIKIVAQPPGKKLVNMMQLSGGEKALTAISLLFAIQNLKPSPFCLLDEIEAALDESNVERFAKYLNKMTKNTQFIVITHRRGTMDQANQLYGITMQEKGVSALVSVNLIDKDLK